MKTRISLPLILSFVFISSVCHSQKKIELMLLVATDSITSSNISETCRFEDQAAGTDIVDYTTYVSLNDEIKWKIKKADGNSTNVQLVKFKHERGTKFFNEDSIPERFGRIKGTIVSGSNNDEEKYAIEIKVKNAENEWDYFTIDPKLQMKQQQ